MTVMNVIWMMAGVTMSNQACIDEYKAIYDSLAKKRQLGILARFFLFREKPST